MPSGWKFFILRSSFFIKKYYGKIPIKTPHCGAYAVDVSEKGSDNASMLFNDALKIAVFAESFGGGKPMTDELTDFIVNWEAEAYRSKQVK